MTLNIANFGVLNETVLVKTRPITYNTNNINIFMLLFNPLFIVQYTKIDNLHGRTHIKKHLFTFTNRFIFKVVSSPKLLLGR